MTPESTAALRHNRPMSLVFVRHGETALNVGRTLQPADTPLSDRGRAQAAAVAARLASMPVAAVLSSDLPRARATAEAIAAATGRPLATTPLLQERNFGDLRGRPYDTLGFDPLAMADAPPAGESLAAFHRRVAEAFAEVLRHRATIGGPVVVVSHGLVIHRIVSAHVALGAAHTVPLAMANTSVTIAGAEAPHLIELLDCVRHLDGAAAHRGANLSGG